MYIWWEIITLFKHCCFVLFSTLISKTKLESTTGICRLKKTTTITIPVKRMQVKFSHEDLKDRQISNIPDCQLSRYIYFFKLRFWSSPIKILFNTTINTRLSKSQTTYSKTQEKVCLTHRVTLLSMRYFNFLQNCSYCFFIHLKFCVAAEKKTYHLHGHSWKLVIKKRSNNCSYINELILGSRP